MITKNIISSRDNSPSRLQPFPELELLADDEDDQNDNAEAQDQNDNAETQDQNDNAETQDQHDNAETQDQN